MQLVPGSSGRTKAKGAAEVVLLRNGYYGCYCIGF